MTCDLDLELRVPRARDIVEVNALHADVRELIGIEQRRAQHVAQGAGARVIGHFLGEIRAGAAAPLRLVDREFCGGDRELELRIPGARG
jgi:hypothetical protein